MTKNLSFKDIMGLAVCWTGAASVTYFDKGDGVTALIAVASAYYLSKWIILGRKQKG